MGRDGLGYETFEGLFLHLQYLAVADYIISKHELDGMRDTLRDIKAQVGVSIVCRAHVRSAEPPLCPGHEGARGG
jgi:hypothetical protein